MSFFAEVNIRGYDPTHLICNAVPAYNIITTQVAGAFAPSPRTTRRAHHGSPRGVQRGGLGTRGIRGAVRAVATSPYDPLSLKYIPVCITPNSWC